MPCSSCFCQRCFFEAEQDQIQKCLACGHCKHVHSSKQAGPYFPANGIPPLGQLQVSEPDANIPKTEHARAQFIIEGPLFHPIRGLLPTPSFGIWARATAGELHRWSAVCELQSFVISVMYDAISAAGLQGKLSCLPALSVFEPRHDIWAVNNNQTGVPVGIIAIKPPTAKILENEHAAGQMYDYLKRLQSYHGLQFAFGLISTYHEWRICWLEDASEIARSDSVVALGDSFSCSTIVEPAETEKKEGEEKGENECAEESIATINDEAKEARRVCASKVLQWNSPELPSVLMSLITKMNASPIHAVATLSPERPYIILKESNNNNNNDDNNNNNNNNNNNDCWMWANVQWVGNATLNRRQLPTNTAACEYILLEDLRGGADGRVWMACTATGRACVIKFARLSAGKSCSSDPVAAAKAKLQKEKDAYDELGIPARVVTLFGRPALLMRCFLPVDPAALTREAKETIKANIMQLARKHHLYHGDLSWRHVVMTSSPPAPKLKDQQQQQHPLPTFHFIDWAASRRIGADEDSEALGQEMIHKLRFEE